ncbi:MAG: sensor domain-containing diguanylate cyclase [Dehalococcoidales bacterium]|nr:sensor domain-containing diguanylate cyclase [Dehalococcoidales bacterium]
MGYSRRLTYRELSTANRACAIITSSLDVSKVFGRFIGELKKILDVNWAAVVLAEPDGLRVLTSFSEFNAKAQVQERIPMQGTASEWVIGNKKPLFQSNVAGDTQFAATEPYYKLRMCSAVHLPLLANKRAIGSLILASRQPDAYNSKQAAFLKQVAAQMAMPIEHSRLYAEVREQSRIDDLTGLLNRRSLDEIIASEIKRHARYGGIFSLVILDIDGFKAFNDKRGHLAGDNLLRKVGRALKSSMRSSDQAFRYGGDEFAVLMPNTMASAGELVCERIRKQIEAQQVGGKIPFTASLGLATWPANGAGPNDLIAAADAALYRAKTAGGNCARQASAKMRKNINKLKFKVKSQK